MGVWLPWMVMFAVMLAVAGVGLFIVLGVSQSEKGTQISDRLEGGLGEAKAPERAGNVLGRLAMKVAPRGGALDRSVKNRSEFNQLLRQAGFRSPQAPAVFLGIQILACGLGVLLPVAYAAAAQPGWSSLVVFMLAFAGFAIAYLATTYTLRSLATTRQDAIRCEVRLFVQLVTMIMDVGLSTRQTLATIAREAKPVLPNLSAELSIALRQIESGGDESEVLHAMGQELDVPELTTILGILRQVEKFGGGIREPLLETLERIEEQNKFRLQELVGKLAGRMTLVMVAFFIPALLAFTAGPGFVAIIRALGNFRAGG